MIYSKDYINMYLSVKKSLHTKNVEKISVEQLKHIGSSYDDELYDHYKKVIFLRWVSENMENKISFSRRVQRLIKKLNIELTDYELKNIEGIEPREFTERRAFKTIEVPYKGNETAFLLQPNAYFFYKGMRTYKKRKLFFVKEFEGEIYITIREIVLYDRKNNEIQEIVPHIDIDKIVLRNEYVEIKMRDGKDSLYLRHKDNELIYISLKRIVTIRGGGGFVAEQRDEFMTTERTIESFLNISDTNESKVKVKANKKKKKK